MSPREPSRAVAWMSAIAIALLVAAANLAIWYQGNEPVAVPDFDGRRCVAFAESSHVVQAVLEGGAAGLVELELVDRELEQGRLVRLFDVGVKVAPDYAYHLVYPAGSRDDPRVQALQDWLDGEVRRRPSGA